MLKQPIRSCLSCGRKSEKSGLLRFVWHQEAVIADKHHTAAGRGAYCCDNEQCRTRFCLDRKKWKRAFRLS